MNELVSHEMGFLGVQTGGYSNGGGHETAMCAMCVHTSALTYVCTYVRMHICTCSRLYAFVPTLVRTCRRAGSSPTRLTILTILTTRISPTSLTTRETSYVPTTHARHYELKKRGGTSTARAGTLAPLGGVHINVYMYIYINMLAARSPLQAQ